MLYIKQKQMVETELKVINNDIIISKLLEHEALILVFPVPQSVQKNLFLKYFYII